MKNPPPAPPHDLSGQTSTLSLERLIAVAEIAVGSTRAGVERELSTMQHARFDHPTNWHNVTKHAAMNLHWQAEALATAADTLNVLMECRDREVITVQRDETKIVSLEQKRAA